ncbi:MAG: SDR family oxidoreductase [Microscillaceae bacterium]|nr:SDR family oxidoreductase [Microscillaceae bacterium]
MQLKNSKILITGGSLGIGKTTARLLVEAGAQVLITGRDEARIQKAAQETGAIPLVADVAQEKDIADTFAWIEQHWGGLDCLINNAGIGEFPSLEEVTLDAFHKVYSINVFGLALMTQHAARIFKAQNYGNIINIASTAATRGFERGTVYASSKFALRGMTECWQAELRKYNIRVMLVNPSEVTTAFNNDERKERESISNKLRPDEIAHAIKAALEMDDRGFIRELTVIATNPF